jgi:hypothetical protein
MPCLSSKKVANLSCYTSPYSSISVQCSAPHSTAQIAITKISYSKWNFWCLRRGSAISLIRSNKLSAFSDLNALRSQLWASPQHTGTKIGIVNVVAVVCVLCSVRIPRHGAVRGVSNNPTAPPTLNFKVPACPLGIITAIPLGTRGLVVKIGAFAWHVPVNHLVKLPNGRSFPL